MQEQIACILVCLLISNDCILVCLFISNFMSLLFPCLHFLLHPTHYSNGQLAVADQGNHRVQVFSRDAVLLRSFGIKGDGPGRLYNPRGKYMLCVCLPCLCTVALRCRIRYNGHMTQGWPLEITISSPSQTTETIDLSLQRLLNNEVTTCDRMQLEKHPTQSI